MAQDGKIQRNFSIGIDLGTSNSVLAFADLTGGGKPRVLEIPQYATETTVKDADTLPSFLYLPEPAVASALGEQGLGPDDWIVGSLALRRASETPARVVHSAKSWLCHPSADRAAPILPWGSEALAGSEKISPVTASAIILAHLKAAWNARFAARGAEYAFDAQEVTVTVPASFDVAAQRLTLEAARQAGYPDRTRLLEEPQAAFYAWLEGHDERGTLSEAARHVLVVDVGGGTSDFCLFEMSAAPKGRAPAIKRVAVSDHILLGGDNIDLALAHLFEPRLVGDGAGLSAGQWDHLVARCRTLKEEALGGDGPGDEAFTVSIPGRGSRLIAQSLSAQATRAEIEALIFEGFFPDCRATDAPRRALGAIKEFGLPYAFDSAVTRHLAGFLAGRPRVDAVLFNGGSLRPQRLRDRLSVQIGRWQGEAPHVLDNARLDLAVALGAAHSGALIARHAARIEAGAARAVFLEAHAEDGAAARGALVCILPQGAAPGEVFALDGLDLRLRVDRLVRFQIYTSTRHERTRAGEVVNFAESDFHALPPLETIATLAEPPQGEAAASIPVQLNASINQLGLLQVSCRSLDPRIDQNWPLEFNLRPHERGARESAAPTPAPPALAPGALDAAGRRLEAAFAKPLGPREKISAPRLFQTLEKTLGRARGDWNALLLRELWAHLQAGQEGRALSVEHEESWLILAGFLLRPGFGVTMDAQRIDALWNLASPGARFQGKRTRLQEYILWRRLAGGLSAERQEALLERERSRLAQPQSAPGELIRMVGSFERLSQDAKARLIESFLATAVELASKRQHCAPYLAALGSLLNRTPLYAGAESVVSPSLVEEAYEALRRFDWTDPELVEARALFLRAARALDDRRLDVSKALRNAIAGKLQKSGEAQNRIDRVRHFAPVERAEQQSLYGEALPPGLILNA